MNRWLVCFAIINTLWQLGEKMEEKLVKRFYKWLEGDNEICPKKVRWIKGKEKINLIYHLKNSLTQPWLR